MNKRVVVTGMGAITPSGIGHDIMWESIAQGKNSIAPITQFDTKDFKAKLAAEVSDFVAEDFIDKKEVRRMDRFNQFAVAAAQLCIEDAKIDLDSVDLNKFGTIVGSGIGGLRVTEQEQTVFLNKGPSRVSPLLVPKIISNMAAGSIAIKYGLKGVCNCPVTACSTGANAIGDAFRMIKHGYAQRIIAGGAEAAITPLGLAGFINLTAVTQSDDPDCASVPFDARRGGFVMGEGCGLVLLEDYELAKARGAHIYGEVVGYGTTCDAYHITATDPNAGGATRSMQEAIDEANITPDMVGYINAHGTGTAINDKSETLAVKKVFKEHANDVSISSTKSMMGHLLGAAGSVEAIICLKAMENSFVPPTINYKEKDPDCDLDYTVNIGRAKEINYSLSNSFGFGGHNVTLVLKKYSE